MPSTNQLSHFAIHADDLDGARKFYGGSMTEFCQIQDSPGNPLALLGAIQSRKFNSALQPVIGLECSFAVQDVDAIARAVEANSGKIVMPKAAIPGVGWIVQFLDTESNLACAVTYHPQAK
jgi:uncharacterized protein